MFLLRFLFFIVILTGIELLFVPFPFAFILLFIWSQFISERDALVGAFISGSLIDLYLLRPLGTTSFLFVALIYLTILYNRKFRARNLVFLITVSFISIIIIEFTYRQSFAIVPAVAGAVSAALLTVVFFKKKANYESWYRVS